MILCTLFRDISDSSNGSYLVATKPAFFNLQHFPQEGNIPAA